jgi:hypothetical protein
VETRATQLEENTLRGIFIIKLAHGHGQPIIQASQSLYSANRCSDDTLSKLLGLGTPQIVLELVVYFNP